jgi:hypothetical protein
MVPRGDMTIQQTHRDRNGFSSDREEGTLRRGATSTVPSPKWLK